MAHIAHVGGTDDRALGTRFLNRAPEGRSGEAMGLRQSCNKFTEVLVPLIFGTVGSAFGIGAAFWMDALLLGGGAFLMKTDARQRASTGKKSTA